MKEELIAIMGIVLGFSSCASVQVNGEAKLRLMKIGSIEKECKKLEGKRVVIKAKYMGWSCPEECKNPGITRSDTCFVDDSGCIYAYGLAGLDPITDRGKEYTVEAEVLRKGETCYLKVLKRNEVR
ncbi:hypothetical protein [Thermovibrio sp.]